MRAGMPARPLWPRRGARRSSAALEVSRAHYPPNEAARLRFPHPPSAASPWQSRTRTLAMQESEVMRVDPTAATNPESFEGLRSWMAIDTAERHQPVGLVVNRRSGIPRSGAGFRDRVRIRRRAASLSGQRARRHSGSGMVVRASLPAPMALRTRWSPERPLPFPWPRAESRGAAVRAGMPARPLWPRRGARRSSAALEVSRAHYPPNEAARLRSPSRQPAPNDTSAKVCRDAGRPDSDTASGELRGASELDGDRHSGAPSTSGAGGDRIVMPSAIRFRDCDSHHTGEDRFEIDFRPLSYTKKTTSSEIRAPGRTSEGKTLGFMKYQDNS